MQGRLKYAGFLAALLMLTLPGLAAATPPPPLTLWGTAKIDGANVPLGTEVSGWCGGVPRVTTTTIEYLGASFYMFAVLGDDPQVPGTDGCLPGETVSFMIGSLAATQTLPWQSNSQELNLTGWTASQPAAITDLEAAIEVSGADQLMKLAWTAVTVDVFGDPISGVTYNIYRAQDEPYFAPGARFAQGVPNAWFTDSQTDVIGNTAHNYTYIVTPVDLALREGQPSNRVAAFAFPLAPGS